MVVGDALSIPLWFVLFVLAASLFAPSEFTSPGSFELAVSYFFWGFVFITILSTNLSGIGQFMLYEQSTGTLEQLLLTPASRLAVIAGRWARVMLTDLIVLVSTTIFLITAVGTSVTLLNPPLVIFLVVLLEFALLGVGLLLAGISLRIRSVASYVNYAWLGVMIFSGVFFPPSSLPKSLETISLILPSTYYVDSIKYYAVGTKTIIAPNLELELLVVITAAFLAIGWFSFDRMEKNAKKRGQLAFS